MKEGIHPNYREVVFLDTSCDFGFVTRSTVSTSETIKWKDGKEYPVYKIEISAESHPFYTGKQKIVDTAGRVDKFKKRYARKSATPPRGASQARAPSKRPLALTGKAASAAFFVAPATIAHAPPPPVDRS